ncbi:MAG: sigma-70 family RNA polymerase sigma factor [Planctomycetes bacterium]|nr:sigma-70 family RNA polymerase sigma factor [Planctomycetota bacterium]
MADDLPRTRALVDRLRAEDGAAAVELAPVLYQELHAIAERLMHHERASHTLQATALVHEAWVKLAGANARLTYDDDRHFLRLAARVMRQVLVDHARAARRRATAREDALVGRYLLAFERRAIDLLGLHDALGRLERIDATLAELVEVRFFAGLTVAETAKALGVSVTSVERNWRSARAWLRREIGPG